MSRSDGVTMGLSMFATVSFLVLWGAVVVDVYRTDHRFVRQGPKWCWLIFVGLLPIFGGLAWMLFGRPFFTVRSDARRAAHEPTECAVGPEDTPEWASYVAGLSTADRSERLD